MYWIHRICTQCYCFVRYSFCTNAQYRKPVTGSFSTCTVAIRNISFMQFIAIKPIFWISNLRINEQNAAALADARAR